MKQRAKPGDIFTEKLPTGEYMFGRVLMDIQEQCFKSGLLKIEDSPLRQASISYLVHGFDVVNTDPILPQDAKPVMYGELVCPTMFKDDSWIVIGNKEVNPSEIDFPEDIYSIGNEFYLSRGEILLTKVIDAPHQFSRNTLLNSPLFFSFLSISINRPELAEVNLDIKKFDKKLIDSNVRKSVYEIFGLDIHQSYYNLALNHGFDTSRFFNDSKTQKQSKPNAKIVDYSKLLKGVSWPFIGKKIDSLKDFHKLAEDNSLEIHSIMVYDQPEIKIFTEYLDENDKDHKIDFTLKADNGKSFNADELLFKIHNEVVEKLNDNDFHFFQGLTLLQKAAKGKPAVYSLDLGS